LADERWQGCVLHHSPCRAALSNSTLLPTLRQCCCCVMLPPLPRGSLDSCSFCCWGWQRWAIPLGAGRNCALEGASVMKQPSDGSSASSLHSLTLFSPAALATDGAGAPGAAPGYRRASLRRVGLSAVSKEGLELSAGLKNLEFPANSELYA